MTGAETRKGERGVDIKRGRGNHEVGLGTERGVGPK
jgi:hypothetical protein